MSTVLKDDDAKRYISANVTRLLKERDMTQADLARATNESEARISMVIHAKRLASSGFLARLAEALGVLADDLLANPKKRKISA